MSDADYDDRVTKLTWSWKLKTAVSGDFVSLNQIVFYGHSTSMVILTPPPYTCHQRERKAYIAQGNSFYILYGSLICMPRG